MTVDLVDISDALLVLPLVGLPKILLLTAGRAKTQMPVSRNTSGEGDKWPICSLQMAMEFLF